MFDYNVEGIFTLLKILFVIYIVNYYYKYFTRPNPLPGPIPLPYIGSNIQIIYKLFKAGRYQFDIGEYAKLQAEEYGEISEMYQGNVRLIFLNNSEHLGGVYLANTNTKYFARPVFDGIKEFDVEHGLFFNSNYKSWKRIRKYVSQSLMSPRFLRGIAITVQQLFEENEYRWNSYDERIMDLSNWIRYFSVDLNKEILTGQKGCCLASFNLKESKWTNEMKEARESIISIELYFRSLTFFTAVPKFVRQHFPIFSHYHNSFMKSLTSFQNKALCRIKERRERMSKGVGVHLLDIMLTAGTPRDPNFKENHDTEEPLTDMEIRDNVLDLTIAGSDTTSNLFALVFWNILTKPEVKARILEEIESFFGQDTTDRRITFEDLEKFKYLDAMIKESMRLRPVLPINGRVLSSTDTVAGYRWDPNTIFLVNNMFIHRQKDHWKEPERFLPDRFLTDQITKNSYNPFGGGIRICPGRLMAMVVIKLLTINFLRKYNIELADKAKPMKCAFAGIYLYSKLMIKLSPKHKKN